MLQEPQRRGRDTARLFATLAPRLFQDLADTGLLERDSIPRARREWECFALYACVRGLIAGGGFNRETAEAIDALHEAALEAEAFRPADDESIADRRRLIAERYAEYGQIGQDGGKSGAATVTARLGAAAARHMTGDDASAELAEIVGALHETLVEGVADTTRGGAP